MTSRTVLLVCLVAGAIGCGEPEPTRLPGLVEGLGSATADCVETCRTLFAECAAITVFVDSSGDTITPAACATDCGSEAEYDAALEAAGCVAEWTAYETCVLGNLDALECEVSECSIEWGVYRGCTGP